MFSLDLQMSFLSTGFINTILSWKAFIPLSRLTYCAYLVHPIVIYHYLYRRHRLIHFSDTEVVSYNDYFERNCFCRLILKLDNEFNVEFVSEINEFCKWSNHIRMIDWLVDCCLKTNVNISAVCRTVTRLQTIDTKTVS